MLICAAGDIHGSVDRFYTDILAFEAELGMLFEHVLHVGDFGVWPDPSRLDKATRRHEGAGDFPTWLEQGREAPRPTIFIKGNHEDFVWLDKQPQGAVLDRLRYLRNGDVVDIEGTDGGIRVGGIGGCYGPSDYERRTRSLQGYARRHYTREDVEALCSRGRLDVLLLHDAPGGVEIVKYRRDGHHRRYVSEAAGLAEAIAVTRPRVCFFGHHHRRVDAEVAGVRCIGLNIVARPGNLVAIDVPARGRDWSVLGEWPAADAAGR